MLNRTRLTTNNLIEAISRLKPKSSSGPDRIPTKIIKSCIAELVHPLGYFINKSVNKEHVHSRLKEALIIPLYKNEEKDKFTTQRPISLLNSISKSLKKRFTYKCTNISQLIRYYPRINLDLDLNIAQNMYYSNLLMTYKLRP